MTNPEKTGFKKIGRTDRHEIIGPSQSVGPKTTFKKRCTEEIVNVNKNNKIPTVFRPFIL